MSERAANAMIGITATCPTAKTNVAAYTLSVRDRIDGGAGSAANLALVDPAFRRAIERDIEHCRDLLTFLRER